MVLCISDLAPFIYSSGRVGLCPALQLTLATDESAWWCWVLAPRATMLGLFFVCITAINSIWDEEPKSEPKLMLEAPVSAGCCSSACPCFGRLRVYLFKTSAFPWFHELSWSPNKPVGRGKVYVTLCSRGEGKRSS